MSQNKSTTITRQKKSNSTEKFQQVVTPVTNAGSGNLWNKRPVKLLPITKQLLVPKKKVNDIGKYKTARLKGFLNPWDPKEHKYIVDQQISEELSSIKERKTKIRNKQNPWELEEPKDEPINVDQVATEIPIVLKKETESSNELSSDALGKASGMEEFQKKFRNDIVTEQHAVEKEEIAETQINELNIKNEELNTLKQKLVLLDEKVLDEKNARQEMNTLYDKSKEELSQKIDEINQLKDNLTYDKNILSQERNEKTVLQEKFIQSNQEVQSIREELNQLKKAEEKQRLVAQKNEQEKILNKSLNLSQSDTSISDSSNNAHIIKNTEVTKQNEDISAVQNANPDAVVVETELVTKKSDVEEVKPEIKEPPATTSIPDPVIDVPKVAAKIPNVEEVKPEIKEPPATTQISEPVVVNPIVTPSIPVEPEAIVEKKGDPGIAQPATKEKAKFKKIGFIEKLSQNFSKKETPKEGAGKIQVIKKRKSNEDKKLITSYKIKRRKKK